MAKPQISHSSVLIFAILVWGLAIVIGEPSKAFTQEANPEAFRIMKKKVINEETGLPKTLDPSLFKGKANKAYEVAKEIPAILAQVPCFCECEAYGHENLLDCFIDNHGAGWMICQEEALLTKKLYDEKIPVDKIKEEIVKKFK